MALQKKKENLNVEGILQIMGEAKKDEKKTLYRVFSFLMI